MKNTPAGRPTRAFTSPRMVVMAMTATLISLAAPTPAVAQQEEEPVSLTDTLPDAELAALIEMGSETFNGGSCVICHDVGGRGNAQRAPDLTDSEWLHSDGSFEGLFRTIVWGVEMDEMKAVTPRPFEMFPLGGMPVPTNEERRALGLYVWSLSADLGNRGSPRVAAQNEFLDLLERDRAEDARSLFERERRDDLESLLFDETAINRLGYEFLLRRSRPETAIALFELNTEAHPDSWNVWDSLGEAHMTVGNRRRAIELYEKSLELNPENDNAREKLAELRD